MELTCLYSALVLLLLNTINPLLATTLIVNSTIDQNALLEFKNTITRDPYGILAKNWSNNASVCQWVGVSCGTKHHRVTALNISGFDLIGTLPPHLGNLTFLRYLDISSNNFTGPVPSELSRLHRLRVIDMGVNSLTGQMPSWLGALNRLEQLHLNNNTFSGKIPEEIGNCSSLQILNLDHNRLTGPIPNGVFNLSSSRVIRVMFNGLSGTLPSDICDNLPNLKTLALSANRIEGRIPPNIRKCRELEILAFSVNPLTGKIPNEIGSLSMLRELYLGLINFEGGVPAELGKLSRLEELHIQTYSLTGSIPKQIGNCTSLKYIDLSDNFLTGTLPQELGNLAFLEDFNVFNNSLSGSIPSSIFNISTLKTLRLSYNRFSGNLHIPSKSSLANLERLHLFSNQLTGEIPSSINNASQLIILELSNNSFSGSIPGFGNLRLIQKLRLWSNNLSGAESPDQELGFLSSLTNSRYLTDLEIAGNPLNGILPASVGNLSTSLWRFSAHNCNINGVIPSTIGNLSGLQFLALATNRLTGSIPLTVGELKQLQILYLGENRLQGYIPTSLCRLSNMGELYLNDNVLTGLLPECLGEVKSLRNVRLDSNKLNSTVPSSLWNVTDLSFLNLSSNYFSGRLSEQIGNLKAINQLDLSHNQLSGDIPSSIDGCQTLEFLSLSNNKFEGSIPSSLGNIRGLSTLDLSNNNLSGSIPKSLENLNLLLYFNVSYNNLEGEVPTRGRFSNFTAQSFFNNYALCGAARFQVPPCIDKDIRRSRQKRIVRLMMYITPPFVSVIIMATIIVVVSMRRRKSKRVSAPADDISLGVSWKRVSYIELVRATSRFSETNLLGKGSFGSVYKGTLSDGLIVAVKVFNVQLERGVRSFDTECEILSKIRHRNLIRIIGCCSNGKEFKALILGYMANGSLDRWLYSDEYRLDLIQTVQIAIDVALALEYLHHGHRFPVVHCDVKPSNVLVDEDMVAHLGDFGIAKLFDNGETTLQTKTLATIGYTAPEYGSEGKVSTKGDVYSYGILLLELLTMKKPTDDMFSEEMSLKEWVNEALEENAMSEVVASHLLTRDDQHLREKIECVSSVFTLAMKCLPVSPDERINMKETVATLQRIKAKLVSGTTGRRQYPLSIIARQ